MDKLLNYYNNLIGNSWTMLLKENLLTLNKVINTLIQQKSKGRTIYPEMKDIFKAYMDVSPKNVKVVILNQEPYFNPDEAIGRAFAINDEKLVPTPFILKNILDEIEREYNDMHLNFDYTLDVWAKQGVFLLNRSLSIQKNKPGSHIKLWEWFTQATIEQLTSKYSGIVFIILGKEMEKCIPYIKQQDKQHILITSYPSHLTVDKGFKGSDIFKKANTCLEQENKSIIDWIGYSIKKGQ